ncbi:DUF1684 domain-containing protein [Rufibacter roseus]|uniref:DUF1684 domain-containing protein n=1 Tax=Rufibacter roseus TaxID=1567108 RepID=A0ABW2DDY7_9BACT|nr:DUF1684 domain-containing protein [Rufibacter roseus]
MNIKKLLVGLTCCLLPVLAQGQNNLDTQYMADIARHRASEDSLFKYGEKSPLPAEVRASFAGLDYFPVDTAYRVKARFVHTPQETIFKMATTTGRLPEYLKYGELHFALQGQLLKLNVYQNQELIRQPKYMNCLFIPFTDATTGHETYATGRYLDFTIPMGADTVWIDFNKAYNPYCAYSPAYSCPIPPKENKLPVRVEAGVKTFEKLGNEKSKVEQPEEVMPEFPGGAAEMFKFISKKFRVPREVKKLDYFKETVQTTFIITAKGELEDVRVVKPVSPSIDAEVIRVIKKMPRWKPGSQNGVPVPFRYNLPIFVVWN